MFHIIDDEKEVGLVLAEIIASVGYPARTFESGGSYLDYFHSSGWSQPIAIISDYNMPGLNGDQLVRIIRQQAPKQKIIMLTALPESVKTHDCLCKIHRKPYQVENLIRTLTALADCDKKYAATARHNDDSVMCEFGLGHRCPFAGHDQ